MSALDIEDHMLDQRPARNDLTSRECAKIVGGTIGVLLQMADASAVRDAVRWWAETDSAWAVGQAMSHELKKATKGPGG